MAMGKVYQSRRHKRNLTSVVDEDNKEKESMANQDGKVGTESQAGEVAARCCGHSFQTCLELVTSSDIEGGGGQKGQGESSKPGRQSWHRVTGWLERCMLYCVLALLYALLGLLSYTLRIERFRSNFFGLYVYLTVWQNIIPTLIITFWVIKDRNMHT